MKCEACTHPSHSCMGMLMPGIGDRCLAVRVELPMFPRPGPQLPARRCEHAASGCNYPEGDCAGLCLATKISGVGAEGDRQLSECPPTWARQSLLPHPNTAKAP